MVINIPWRVGSSRVDIYHLVKCVWPHHSGMAFFGSLVSVNTALPTDQAVSSALNTKLPVCQALSAPAGVWRRDACVALSSLPGAG